MEHKNQNLAELYKVYTQKILIFNKKENTWLLL